MLLGPEKTRNQVETYNISSEDQITVTEITQTVTQETEIVAVSKYILKVLWEQFFEREH